MRGKFISWMPLYSIQAWGRFYGPYPFGYLWSGFPGCYGYAVYRRQPTPHGIICLKEKYYQPANPQTPTQQAWRGWFASGVKGWQDLTEADHKRYNSYSYPLQLSGYHKFLHYYLRDKVS